MSIFNDAIEVDLHNLRLYDAEVEICAAIEEAWFNGKQCLLLIHGYNNGVAIREFIRRRGGLRKQMARNYPEIPELEIRPRDHGSTFVVIQERVRVGEVA